MTWSIGSKIRLPRQKAFSILELLVVVVVLGIIIGISLPRFRNSYNNLVFNNFTQNLISRMHFLQERATVEQCMYRIVFDPLNNKFTIGAREEDQSEFTSVKDRLGRSISIPSQISIEMAEPLVIFYPDGRIKGKDFAISGFDNKATVTIKQAIGRIELLTDE